MARALAVCTGSNSEFGKISERLKLRPPETEFEHGVRHFGYLLVEVTLLLVFGIFAVNVYLARPFLDSFLFSLALAVGLTPQLLPAIISVNLAHGAKNMATGEGYRQAPLFDRELRQHERAVFGQDRHADGGGRTAAFRPGRRGQGERESPPLFLPERILRVRLHQPHRRGHSHPPPIRPGWLPEAGRGALRLPAQAFECSRRRPG